jgi:hypothetical protein
MADDNFKRSFTSGFGRTAPPRTSPANDPLAELARLIGQNDPFAEFGRAPQQAPAAQSQRQPHPRYPQEPQAWDRQGSYVAPPVVPGYEQGVGPRDQYQDDPAQTGYEATTQRGYYEPDYRDDEHYDYGSDQAGDEAYDDVPPRRNRLGVIVIASVVTLAVVGTAAAFGYRALFGSSGSSPPPVIKADAGPSKVVPPSKSEAAAASKQFNDRVGERIVSREEAPMERPQPPAYPMPSVAQQAASIPEASPMQSIAEPKRVRTIPIRPDGQPMAEPEPARGQPPAAAQPQPRPAAAPRSSVEQPPRVASAPAIASADPEPPVTAAAPARPAPQRNGPLSLSPDASTSPPPAPARTASASAMAATPPATSSSASGQYGVQVTSQRSEAEAQAAFRTLQAKYPSQLGGHQPVIRRADLGEKGTYYRAMVPFSNGSDEVALCNSLKAAGGSCIIQKN